MLKFLAILVALLPATGKIYTPTGAGVCRDANCNYPSWGWALTDEQSAIDACDAEPECTGYSNTASGTYQIFCSSSATVGYCINAGNGGGPINGGCDTEITGPCMVASATTTTTPTCLPTRTAPADDGGLVAIGALWKNEQPNRPPECGPTYWIGEPFQVPDTCCTTDSGSVEWVPYDLIFSAEKPKCAPAYPFGAAVPIAPVIVSGCSADGVQFYGEKCGGSNFAGTGFSDLENYGPCGPKAEECDCFTYLTATEPSCWAIATPDPGLMVFLKAGGCKPKCPPGCLPAQARATTSERKLLFGGVPEACPEDCVL